MYVCMYVCMSEYVCGTNLFNYLVTKKFLNTNLYRDYKL